MAAFGFLCLVSTASEEKKRQKQAKRSDFSIIIPKPSSCKTAEDKADKYRQALDLQMKQVEKTRFSR